MYFRLEYYILQIIGVGLRFQRNVLIERVRKVQKINFSWFMRSHRGLVSSPKRRKGEYIPMEGRKSILLYVRFSSKRK